MQHVALLKRGAQGAMKSVLKIEVAPPAHDVREEVAEECGVLVEQGGELKSVLGGDQLIQPQWMRWQ